jgi:hypothetical protein
MNDVNERKDVETPSRGEGCIGLAAGTVARMGSASRHRAKCSCERQRVVVAQNHSLALAATIEHHGTQLTGPGFFTVSERLKIRHTAYDSTIVATNVIAAVVPESFAERDMAAAIE